MDHLAWAGRCDCAATLHASGHALSREVMGAMPGEAGAEATLPITRRNSGFTFEQYVTENFAFGVPVIVEGAVEGWPLLAIAGAGNPTCVEVSFVVLLVIFL